MASEKKYQYQRIVYAFIKSICCILGVTVIFLLITLFIGRNDLKDAESKVDWTIFEEERIPLPEQIRHDIGNLKVPEKLKQKMRAEMLAAEKARAEAEKAKAEEIKAEDITSLNYDIPIAEGSEEEVLLLAQLMHAEEGMLCLSESPEDLKLAHLLAGSVVIHRRNMNYRGATTIQQVIFTPSQYESVPKLNQEVPDRTIEWARELLQNGPIGPDDLIYQSQRTQGNSLVEGDTTYAHIGNQYFCTENPIK